MSYAYDLFKQKNRPEAKERKTMEAKAFAEITKTIEGAKSIVVFVTTDRNESGNRGYSFRTLLVTKEDHYIFGVLEGNPVGSFEDRRDVVSFHESIAESTMGFYLDSKGEPRIRPVKEQPLPFESQSSIEAPTTRAPGKAKGPYPPLLPIPWHNGHAIATDKKGEVAILGRLYMDKTQRQECGVTHTMGDPDHPGYGLELALEKWNAEHPNDPPIKARPEDLGERTTPAVNKTLEECYEIGFEWIDEGSDVESMKSMMERNGHSFNSKEIMRAYNSHS